VKRGNKEQCLLGGSAKILDRNLAVAAGFGVVSLSLRRSLNRVNFYFFGSGLDFLPVFLVEIS
jgi:hypothetical protein